MSMSVSTSFPGESYEFDNIEVNVNGKISCTYYYYGSCSIQCPSSNLMDIIESMLYKFVKMLPNLIDMSFDTVDFFGDVKAVDDDIKKFPVYFILSGKKYSLFKIDPNDVTRISLISEFKDFDGAIDYLSSIDSQLVVEYFSYDEDEYEDDEYDKGTSGIMHDAIDGDYHGNIGGIMHGDVNGNMYGDINGIMHGDINGNMYGDINGIMHGNIVGDMHGDIYGKMHGDIEGVFSGEVYGEFEG